MWRHILVVMMLTKETFNQRLILAGNNSSPLIPNKSRVRLSCVTENQWFFCMWYSPSSDVQCAIQHNEPRSVCDENPRIELEGGQKYCDITIQIEPEDHGQWLCVVNDLITFDAKKKYVDVNVGIEASLELSIDGGEVEDGVLTAEEGSIIDIRCETGYGFPSPSLTWFGPPRPDLNNSQHNPLKVFQAFESQDANSHTVAVKQSVRYIPSTEDTNKTISCSMVQAMDGITHHTRTLSQRLNITRRVVSPGGPLIQGVSILSGLILLLIIVILTCSLIVALVIRQQTKKKREEKLLQLKEEQYSLVHAENERPDDCESTPRCYSQRPQINPRVQQQQQQQNLQYHEYRNRLSDCNGSLESQELSASHQHPPHPGHPGHQGQHPGHHGQGAFIQPNRQLINPVTGKDGQIIVSPSSEAGHPLRPPQQPRNGDLTNGRLAETLEAISKSGIPLATGQTVLTTAAAGVVGAGCLTNGRLAETLEAISKSGIPLATGQTVLTTAAAGVVGAGSVNGKKNGNVHNNRRKFDKSTTTGGGRDVVVIHNSESGGFEDEYQEPYAGSPVPGCQACDIVRARGTLPTVDTRHVGRAPGSDSPGSRTADQSFESRCGGESPESRIGGVSPDSVAPSSILRSGTRSPESVRTGTTYPMYRSSSGAQTPDSCAPSTSSAPHSKHSTLSAGAVSRGDPGSSRMRTPESGHDMSIHLDRSTANTPAGYHSSSDTTGRYHTPEPGLYQSPPGLCQSPSVCGSGGGPNGYVSSPASGGPGNVLSPLKGGGSGSPASDLCQYHSPVHSSTSPGYASPEHHYQTTTPESSSRFQTPDSGRHPGFPGLPGLPGHPGSEAQVHSSPGSVQSPIYARIQSPLSRRGLQSPDSPLGGRSGSAGGRSGSSGGGGGGASQSPRSGRSYQHSSPDRSSDAQTTPTNTGFYTPEPRKQVTSPEFVRYQQQSPSATPRGSATPCGESARSPTSPLSPAAPLSPSGHMSPTDPAMAMLPGHDQRGGDDPVKSPVLSALSGSDVKSSKSSRSALSGSDLKSSRSGTKSFEIDVDTESDIHLGYSAGYSTDQSSLPKRYRRSRSLSASDLSISYSAEDLTKSCRLLSHQYADMVSPGSVPALDKLPIRTLMNPATKSLANLHSDKNCRRRRSKTGPTSKSTNSVFECEEGCFRLENNKSQQVSINMGPVVL